VNPSEKTITRSVFYTSPEYLAAVDKLFSDHAAEFKSYLLSFHSMPTTPLTELALRHTYHAPKPGQPEKYSAIRAKAWELAILVNELCPDSREASTAQTKIEESVFWANAAIARRGL
jgi:hypothetical protein